MTSREEQQTVLVVGSQGRMGQCAIDALGPASDLHLVGTVARGEDLCERLETLRPRIAVDFTEPSVVANHLEAYLRAGVCPVIGTTGLEPKTCRRLIDLSRELGVGGLIAPNFSLGAVLMIELSRRVARHFSDAEIVESHHPGKRDAPSGTALFTRERIAGEHQDAPREREIPIHSVRLPGFLARQEVTFGGTGERLSLTHEAIDRTCYMPGVLLACRKVGSLSEVMFGLETLLD